MLYLNKFIRFYCKIEQKIFQLNNYGKFDQKVMVNWLENNIIK